MEDYGDVTIINSHRAEKYQKETDESKAKTILKNLEDNPSVFEQFNLLLRQKKLKQLKDNGR